MINFFKNFAKGILYVLVLPFLLIILALYFGVSVIIFCYLGIKGIILFFTGRNLFGDLPEDIEAKKILNGEQNIISQEEENKPNNEAPLNNSSNMNLYPSGYTTDIFNAVFNNEEEKPINNEEEINESTELVEDNPISDDTKENNNIDQTETNEPQEEIIGRYVPFTGRKKETSTTNETNNEESGVTITDFDGGND